MMTTLESLRDSLATIPGVASCKVGIEGNISPQDYPLVRIVPSRITPGRPYQNRQAECLIYFGAPTANSEGMETVYEDLFDMESAILEKLRAFGGRYLETVTDEDRLETYKCMAVRCELFAANPAPPAPPAPTPAPEPTPEPEPAP